MILDKQSILSILAKSKTEIANYLRQSLLYYKDTDVPNLFVMLQPFFKLPRAGNDDKILVTMLEAYKAYGPDVIQMLALLHQRQLFRPSTLYPFIKHRSPQVLASFILEVNSLGMLTEDQFTKIIGDNKLEDRVYAFGILNKVKFTRSQDKQHLAKLLLDSLNPREAIDGFVLYIQTIFSIDHRRKIDFDELISMYGKLGTDIHIKFSEQYMPRKNPLSLVNALILLYKNDIRLEQNNQIVRNMTRFLVEHPYPEKLAEAYVLLDQNNYLYAGTKYHLSNIYNIGTAQDPVAEVNSWLKLLKENKFPEESELSTQKFVARQESPSVNFVSTCPSDDGASVFTPKLQVSKAAVAELVSDYNKKKKSLLKLFSPTNEAINKIIRLIAEASDDQIDSADLLKIFFDSTFQEGHPTFEAYNAVLSLIGIKNPDLIGALQLLKDAGLLESSHIEDVLKNPYDHLSAGYKIVERYANSQAQSTSSL